MTRVIPLDPASPADAVGFRALALVVDVVGGLPEAAWRIVGGWMVRAWLQGEGPSDARATTDVDLALLASRGARKAQAVPDRLEEAGLAPGEEPFRLRGPDGILVDLLVPPGASRHQPPRLGDHVVFEVRGSRFGFELPAEPASVSLGADRLSFPTMRLSAALVLKVVVLGLGRPSRVEVDAVDVARLLDVVRREPDEAIADLRAHTRRRDVKAAVAGLTDLFGQETDPGAAHVARALGDTRALTAVADARWLVDQVQG